MEEGFDEFHSGGSGAGLLEDQHACRVSGGLLIVSWRMLHQVASIFHCWEFQFCRKTQRYFYVFCPGLFPKKALLFLDYPPLSLHHFLPLLATEGFCDQDPHKVLLGFRAKLTELAFPCKKWFSYDTKSQNSLFSSLSLLSCLLMRTSTFTFFLAFSPFIGESFTSQSGLKIVYSFSKRQPKI